MLTEKEIVLLQDNWGEKADALACKAIVLLANDLGYEVYIYAMCPEDNDLVHYLYRYKDVVSICTDISLDQTLSSFESVGNPLLKDKKFKPANVAYLYKHFLKTAWNYEDFT